MKRLENTNSTNGKNDTMTFVDYYNGLPSFSTPKKDFIDEICQRCEVSEMTVRNWIAGRNKPQKESHYHILSEMTGIEPEELFAY